MKTALLPVLSISAILFLLSPARAQMAAPASVGTAPMLSASEWNQKGKEAYTAGQYAEAADDFRQALKLAPPDQAAVINSNLARTQRSWARNLRTAKDYRGAIAHFHNALKIDNVSDPSTAAQDMDNIGNIYTVHLSQPAKAIACFQQGLALARKGADTKVEMSILGNLGATYWGQRDYDKAMVFDTQELVLAQKLGDLSAQIDILNTMGNIQFLRNDDDKASLYYGQEVNLQKAQGNLTGAIETLNKLQSLYFLAEKYEQCADTKAQMLTMQRTAGDDAGARKTLSSLGAIYGKAGVYAKSIAFLDELLAQQRADKDQAGEAQTLGNLAQDYHKTSQPEHALALLAQALAINQALGNSANTARVLCEMGVVHSDDLHHFDQGISLYTQALAMQRQNHDTQAEGKTLSTMGLTYIRAGQDTQGLEYCKQALALQQNGKDPEALAKTLSSIGTAYLNLEQPDKALAVFQQAAPLMHKTKNPDGEIYALVGAGRASADLDDFTHATQYYQQALALNVKLKDPETDGTILNNLVEIYKNQGDYASALQGMKKVVVIFHALGNAKNEATTQANLGEVYSELGQPDLAIDAYTQALAVQKSIGDRAGIVATLGNLGSASQQLGRNAEALDYFTQSLALARERKDRAGEATALTNIGTVQDDLGQTQAAIETFQQAAAIFTALKDLHSLAATLNDLGVVYNHTKQTTLSVNAYMLALQTQRQINDRDGQAVTLGNLMLLWSLTQPEAAIWCGKSAVNTYQEIRGGLQATDTTGGDLQRGFASTRESVYRNLADVLITQGRLTEARQVLRMLKQEEFFDFLGRDPKSAPTLQQRISLTPDETEGQKRYAALPKDADVTPLMDEMKIALRAARSRKTVISLSSETGGLSQMLAALGPGTAALYTIVEPDKYRVIVVTSAFQRADEYSIKSDNLYRKVLAFRNALQDPAHDPRPLAQDLYKILLGPVAADLKSAHITTILWSLDDALRYLPCAALYDGHHYLVERYSMGVLTSAGESAVTTAGHAPPWRGLGLGVSLAHEDFPALPGVPQELGGIVQSQPGQASGVLPGTVLLNGGFTRQALTHALTQNHGRVPRYPVVHIASHFALGSRDTNSFLLLGDGSHLTVAQLKTDPHFFQGVDLLTLSACNTAIDVKSANGKEVEGFGALAQRLGARSVLASLWPVADASTPVLMREFYRLRRQNPKRSKATDLRQAQIELLTGQVTASALPGKTNRARRAKVAGAIDTTLPSFAASLKAPYAHPYYWAPFVLIGSPQ